MIFIISSNATLKDTFRGENSDDVSSSKPQVTPKFVIYTQKRGNEDPLPTFLYECTPHPFSGIC